ncbi:SPOR domain-containing protein [Dysgonomonas massiliensis]|uniref:SPOR domain-containing protein n=1 Tax=Dysgonomonas massiliensis TaxID=2040292 RepID=UPI000C78B806|nr:SPOR domain-containing protein [Dysgonomonas massiliensis]
MKKIYCILIMILSVYQLTYAQEVRSIIDDINTPKRGQGSVRVLQDESIDGLLGTYFVADSTNRNYDNTPYVRSKGYKIQVFSGNNQAKSKAEAQRKYREVKNAFPEYEVVINYNEPFWRVRVGNFITRDGAELVLKELRQKFPSFGKEMTIVEDMIKRPSF